jgi:hypothetical protein
VSLTLKENVQEAEPPGSLTVSRTDRSPTGTTDPLAGPMVTSTVTGWAQLPVATKLL